MEPKSKSSNKNRHRSDLISASGALWHPQRFRDWGIGYSVTESAADYFWLYSPLLCSLIGRYAFHISFSHSC